MSESVTPSASQPHPNAPSDRRMFVHVMIAIAVLLFLATQALLYYRWVTMSEPSCVLVIDAGPALKGAEISVDSVEMAKPLQATIGLNDRYAIPFYLDPGKYDVKLKLNGQTQIEANVELTRSERGRRLDLTRFHPT